MNGKYSNGKQRFYCLQCKQSFSRKNSAVKKNNEFIWFERWVVGGYTFKQLVDLSKRSIRNLQQLINFWFDCPPKDQPCCLKTYKNIVFDGSYIWKRKISVAIVMDYQSKKLIKGAYNLKENNLKDLIVFFSRLQSFGLAPESITTDGNPTVIRALNQVWPNTLIQRCLVHIQRQGLMWCRIKPKTTNARQLRNLFLEVTNIKTKEERNCFLTKLNQWENKYGLKIKMQKEHGWVFSDLKRARGMIMNSLPNMFWYLENPKIPWNTNLAEGYFSHMKKRYLEHRGLARQKREAFFTWFFFLKH